MRVFLFGIDGMTFDIIHPYLERGLLPNFQRLQHEGAHGILKSTVLPLTPIAWMSISTGLSPAKHGTFDFWTFEYTDSGLHAHVLTHRKGGKAIWNVLSELGKSVVVANVPLTYPPEPINGIMLSGYMAPGIKADVTFPKAFQEELLKAVPGYQIDLDPAVSVEQVGDRFTAILKMTDRRVAMLRLLLQKPWDFFYIVFTGADRIQHARWPEIKAFHPQAVAYYQKVDEALGLVMETLQADDMLVVVSDHGFQGIQRQFYLQEYLSREGFLRVSERASRSHRRAEVRHQVADLVRNVLWALKLKGVPTLIRRQFYRLGIGTLKAIAPREPDFDWAHTHAWLQSVSGESSGFADILFDDTVTEEQIDELALALQEITDPETGNPLVVATYREDAFGSGPFAPGERHLVLISGENITFRTETGKKSLWNTCRQFGIHHPDGILYLYGANVHKGKTMDPAHVYDIVPTIFACMGLPLPADLDGAVLTEAFEQLPSWESRQKGESKVREKLKKLAILQSE